MLKLTSREQELQDEIDSLRDQESEREEREYREREQRRREREQEISREDRIADTWPEALRKQVYLCQCEVDDGGDESVDDFFATTAEACQKAQELWIEVEASRQPAIEELEKQIAVIRDGIRIEVANRLEATDSRSQFSNVAGQIRGDDLRQFLNW